PHPPRRPSASKTRVNELMAARHPIPPWRGERGSAAFAPLLTHPVPSATNGGGLHENRWISVPLARDKGAAPGTKTEGATMTYSRICTRARGLLVATALAGAAALPALRPADAGPNYDGLWSVVIVTKSGQCDAAYRY